ncbi:MAG: DUF45 domain-containing protein [Proteobacteria bacterium]|nr:DUF45 domain-containing protein [Pseudomonadota bacterium]HQR04973.1 DUF45 domain-containing protein [Rhodocyclaceae bacterium]
MKKRVPQLALHLDSLSTTALPRPWQDGASLPHLGGCLRLKLDTDRKTARLEGDELHLPLPPEAGERQIRDAAEAWQRGEARRILTAAIRRQAGQLCCTPPALRLSFAASGHWVQSEDHGLRCHWRLIEQSPAIIEQLIGQAVARYRPAGTTGDLFAFA